MSWVLIALLGAAAADPCEYLQQSTDDLTEAARASEPKQTDDSHSASRAVQGDSPRSGATVADLDIDAIEVRLESELGRPLLRDSERSIALEARADLIGRRAKAACALKSRFSGPLIEPANRQRLKEILDRPVFAEARKRNPDWLARWLNRLSEWLSSLFEAEGAQTFASFTRALVLGLALAAAVAGAIRLARRRPRVTKAPAHPTATVNAERLEDPAVHLSLAQDALGRDPREAIRQGLLALLSWLERRRLARPDRAKTNRELAHELPQRGASAELSDAVGRLLRWYDVAFYSLSPVQAPEARDFLQQVSSLQSSARDAS